MTDILQKKSDLYLLKQQNEGTLKKITWILKISRRPYKFMFLTNLNNRYCNRIISNKWYINRQIILLF